MTCEVYEGDRVEIRVPYGLFRGTVNDFKKMNQKEYSIKLVNIEVLDEAKESATGDCSNDRSGPENEAKQTLSCHRFWHYEVQDLKIFKRHQSPEKVINQELFGTLAIQSTSILIRTLKSNGQQTTMAKSLYQKFINLDQI